MDNRSTNNHTAEPPVLLDKTISNDVFLDSLLKTLNSVFEKFKLIKREGNIYVIGYDKDTYSGVIPKKGGDLDIAYPERDVVIIDKDCVIPFTREHMEKTGRYDERYEDIDWLLGYTAGCEIFADIFLGT